MVDSSGFDGNGFNGSDSEDFAGSDNFGDNFLTSEYGSTNSSGSDDNSVVTARGTGDGLVLRLDGRIQLHALKAALLSYVETRQGFLVGQEVIFEWLGARPEEGVVAELTQILSSRFGVLVKASRMAERQSSKSESHHAKEPAALDTDKPINLGQQKGLANQVEGRRSPTEEPAVSASASASSNYSSNSYSNSLNNSGSDSYKPKLSPVDGERFDRVSRVSPSASSSTSLFDGLSGSNGITATNGNNALAAGGMPGTVAASGVINESLLWDDPDTRIIRQTLRSGQKIESEFSVVINGDVNSGAEVVAGGDVIVLGKLRGVAHAGAFEESGRGRFIFAVQMQPTQLRIGSVISRGNMSRAGATEESSNGPEIAKVEGTMISVEPFMKQSPQGTTIKRRW